MPRKPIPAQLIAMAGAQTGPSYRFHGRQRPVRNSVLSVKNAVPDNAGDSLTAVLRLYDPIDSWGGEWGVSASEFIAAIDALPSSTQTIELHLNSPGGEVFEAVAILNALRRTDAQVVAVVDGLAASAASFLAAGADQTIMAPNSQLMIHDASGLCIGNAGDMRSTADLLDQLSDNIASIYADKTGASTEDWRAAMQAETWYDAQAAVGAGLADSIEGAAPEALNTFDLSLFARNQPPVPDIEPAKPAPPVDKNPTPSPASDDRSEAFAARLAAEGERRSSRFAARQLTTAS